MKYQKKIISIVFAACLLLGSGVLQGIAWCADSLCTTCGDGNNAQYHPEFDSALWQSGEENSTASQTPGTQSSSSNSGRNFVKKGSGSE